MRRSSRQIESQYAPPCAASHSPTPSAFAVRTPTRAVRSLMPTYLMLLSVLVYPGKPHVAHAQDHVAHAKSEVAQAQSEKPVKNATPSPAWPITTPLPPAAQDMYEAILSAVHSGAIDELKVAFDLGELKADIADEPISDPVAYWKMQSADGEGREILAIISNLFAIGAAEVARGQDPENSGVYVWPYFAELPLDKLTPAQQVDLLRIVPAAEAKSMMAKKTYSGWRLTIGADGLWHAFKRGT